MVLKLKLCRNVLLNLGDRKTNLLHRISVTNGNASVVLGIEVVGDAEGSTDLILTAISLTDRAGLIKLAGELLSKLVVKLESLLGELLGKRKHCCLDGSKSGMKVKNYSYVTLTDGLLIVSVNEECKSNSVCAERGLYNVRNVVLVGLGVEVRHILAGVLLMLTEVVIGSVRYSPKLAPSEGEEELEVGGSLGIEAKLVGIVIAKSEVLASHTEVEEPLVTEVLPILEPLEVGAGLAEELKLHLLELTGTEGEVAGGDLVSEGLTDLSYAEGKLSSGRALNAGEVNEDTLSGLGTKIYGIGRILGYTYESLEHKVELLYISKIVAAAKRTYDALLLDIGSHLIEGPGSGVVIKTVLECVVLNELVRSVTSLTALAVHKRVGEAANVTGSYPSLRVHDDSRVKTYVISGLLNELLPPSIFLDPK